MMNYRYDKKKKIRQGWYLLASVTISLVLFTNVYDRLFDTFEKPIVQSLENKEEIFSDTENFFESFISKKALVKKHKELQQEITRLSIENMRVSYLESELSELYNLAETNTQVARVVLNDSGVMLINKGEEQGIRTGDRVSAYNNVAIGYVSEVYDQSARIILYSRTGESLAGVLFPYDVNLRIDGYGGGSFIMETPREIEATVGDIVYSLEQPGKIIAVVRSVEFDPRNPFKQVYLSYPVNLSEIQMVGIESQIQNTQ